MIKAYEHHNNKVAIKFMCICAMMTFLLLSATKCTVPEHISMSQPMQTSVQSEPIPTTLPAELTTRLRLPKAIPGVRYQSQSNEDRALYEKIYRFHVPRHGGVILEMGALDGETYSISKFFERYLGWKSLLIEANPDNYNALVRNRPDATNVHTAICEGPSITFVGSGAVGGAKEFMKEGHADRWINPSDKEVTVPCNTFEKVFSDNGITGIDVFILDIEGGELDALKTMDWNVPVSIFVIELNGGPKDDELRALLKSHGYVATDWDIRDFCAKGGDCSANEAFVRADDPMNI